MCWNQQVSMNTFLFSSFVILLAMYNNTYTQYKMNESNAFYVFCMTGVSMQLAEFFLWRNLHTEYNRLFTYLAYFILLIQPVASLMIISNQSLRNTLLTLYIVVSIGYIASKIPFLSTAKTVKTNMGHLDWFNGKNKREWFDILYISVWFFCLLFGLFYERKFVYFLFGIVTLMIVSVWLASDKGTGSVWCWVVNSLSIYLACYLLFYLPFRETTKDMLIKRQ